MITPRRLGYVGPGMSGPEVVEIQQLIGATVTGLYDEETTQRVRGLQVLHGTTAQDGMFDDELESALRQTPGMSS